MCRTLQKWLISNHINCECIPKEGKQQSVLCTNLGYKKKKKNLSTDYIKPPDSVHWLHWGWEKSVVKMSISKTGTMQANLMSDSPSSPSLVSASSCTIWMSANDQNSHQSFIQQTWVSAGSRALCKCFMGTKKKK